MSMAKKSFSLPTPSSAMAWEEFLEHTGIAPERLQELLTLGWIEVRTISVTEHLFCAADVYRVRKLERICCDFELPVLGGTIIVDLLERIDTLECTVRGLKGRE